MRQIVVLYDGWCAFCIQSIKSFQRLDFLKRIEFQSFRDENIVRKYKIDINALENRIHSIKKSNGVVEDGIDSINRICKNTPLLWIVVPILSIFSAIGLGQKIYDWIASKRTIFPTGGCDSDSCELPISKARK